MLKQLLLVMGLVLSITLPVQAADFKTVEVLPDIYTLMPKSGPGPNATFIVTGEGVIVIDTGPSPVAGKELKNVIARYTDQPVVYVINTHYHGENTFGNEAFKGSQRIANKRAIASMLGKPGEYQRKLWDKMHPEEKINLTLPNVSFETELGLRLGKYFLRLIHPKGAHTGGDLYVYIPSYRLIITGGLVNAGQIPDLSEAYIDSWIKALRVMEDLDAEYIVPGQGHPGDKPTITLMKHYLMELKTYVTEALEDGGTLPDIQKKVRERLGKKYGEWMNQDLIDANIKRAFFQFVEE